jgi:hypothetical protein
MFRHVDDVPWQEVRAQRHGERRVGVHLKFMEWTDRRTLIMTRYDPTLVLDVHGHGSDHMIVVTAGSLTISGHHCTPGTVVILEHGAVFGPIEVGPQGAELIEFYTGDVTASPADPEGYQRLLAERGIVELPHPPFDPTLAGG